MISQNRIYDIKNVDFIVKRRLIQDKLSVMAELVLERNNLIAGIVYHGQLTMPTDKQLI